MAQQRLDTQKLIDDGRFSGYQAWIFALCFLLALLDGYDAQSLGAIGPAVIQSLHLSPAEFGTVFSLGGIGVLFGALTFGMLADRWGRRMMLVISAAIFGAFSIMMALSTSGQELTIYRFLSALGLGGAVPNALAFAAEYAPRRMRASVVTLLWAALPAGGMIGSFLAAYLIPIFGWPSVYIIGGVLPLAIGLLVFFSLPESLAFLVAMGKDRRQIVRIVARVAPRVAVGPDTEFYSNETKLPGVPVKHLFSDGRASGTILIWVLFVMSFFSMLTIVAWSSNMVRISGASVSQASAALGWYNLGSLVASVTVGALIDRFGPFRILTGYFLAMAVAIGALGFTLSAPFAVVCAMFIAVGFFTGGSNSGIMALGTLFYPVSVRGTGVGWAYAWGRIGATVGPMIGGILIQAKWDVSAVCLIIGVPAVIAAATTLALRSVRSARTGDEVAAAA
jgi:AAHS family 4-hydroxybenzoate transporter-like MFS transporter